MRRIGFVVAVTVLLGTGGGLAQEGGEQPRVGQDREAAQQKAREGMEAFDAGRFVEAARLFEEAQTLFQHPSNLFNAAKAWEKAAEYQKAADAYRAYLDLFAAQNDGATPPDGEDVQRTIDVMRQKAFLALPEVTIDSDPPGADIYVDDPERLLGQTPFTTHLPEGSHKVFLRKAGYQGFEREFLVRSREPLRLSFALERIRNDGFLRVFVNIRKARIYVDGKVVAASPLEEPLKLEAGRHQVLVEKDDYTQKAEVVEIRAGAVTDVHAELVLVHNPFSWRGGVGVASMILGAGGLGAGFWLRYEANKEFNTTNRFKTYRTWAYVGYGVGSGLLALGTGLIIWEYTRKAVRPEDRLEARTTWAPFAIPGPEGRSAVLGVSGSW
ncbi:PEGA domain-containing protein [Myxococcota bacterium]|nr:PEGA domain-containing protein [Myxococcota bacterium]